MCTSVFRFLSVAVIVLNGCKIFIFSSLITLMDSSYQRYTSVVYQTYQPGMVTMKEGPTKYVIDLSLVHRFRVDMKKTGYDILLLSAVEKCNMHCQNSRPETAPKKFSCQCFLCGDHIDHSI